MGRTSMEIGVKIVKDNPTTSKQVHVATAYLTFVAIDKNRKPCDVPPLRVKTKDDIRRYKDAEDRHKIRKNMIDKVRTQKEHLLNRYNN